MTKEYLQSLDIYQLLELQTELCRVISQKYYGVGYKDGFNDGVESAGDKALLERMANKPFEEAAEEKDCNNCKFGSLGYDIEPCRRCVGSESNNMKHIKED